MSVHPLYGPGKISLWDLDFDLAAKSDGSKISFDATDGVSATELSLLGLAASDLNGVTSQYNFDPSKVNLDEFVTQYRPFLTNPALPLDQANLYALADYDANLVSSLTSALKGKPPTLSNIIDAAESLLPLFPNNTLYRLSLAGKIPTAQDPSYAILKPAYAGLPFNGPIISTNASLLPGESDLYGETIGAKAYTLLNTIGTPQAQALFKTNGLDTFFNGREYVLDPADLERYLNLSLSDVQSVIPGVNLRDGLNIQETQAILSLLAKARPNNPAVPPVTGTPTERFEASLKQSLDSMLRALSQSGLISPGFRYTYPAPMTTVPAPAIAPGNMMLTMPAGSGTNGMYGPMSLTDLAAA